MRGFEIQKLIRYAWIQLIIGAVISFAVMLFAIKLVHTDIFEYAVKEVGVQHKIVQSLVQKFKNNQITLLEMLSNNKDLKAFAVNAKKTTAVEKLFYNTVKSHKNIMQLRYIDILGNEKFRVDQSRDGVIRLISEDNLQNKADRYYFKEFVKVSQGETGYSSFDLNEEFGVVEHPYNPTLRMAQGVYVESELVGIVVINFFMQEWVESIVNFEHVKIAMINKEGHFLMNYNPQWAWTAYSKEPKKALDAPLIEVMPDFEKTNKEYYRLSDSVISKKMRLFNENVLVAYELEKPLNSLIIDKVLELSGVFLISFLMVIVPMLILIYRYIQLTNQDSKFLKNILDNMFDSLIVIDKKGIVQHANSTTEALFGYKKEELLHENIKLLVPEPHKSEHDSYVQNYKEKERAIIGKERDLMGVHKDGSQIPISLVVTRVEADNTTYFIGTVRDLSEIKELENKAKEQEALIIYQTKLASMGEMIGAIAHQWRQPLNELGIRIQKLKYSYEDGKVDENFVDEFIEKNKTTIKFMSDTIDNFRNFFRVDKVKYDFFVKKSVEDVANMLDSQLKKNYISLEIEGEEFSFYGLKTEFQQVIMNLIGNSRDAFLSNNIKDPKIKMTLTPNKLTVEDNAGGVPQEVLEKIFDPYFTTKEQGKGTGMGLYMSKMTIENNMNSTISIVNKNKGILVTIKFNEATTDHE